MKTHQISLVLIAALVLIIVSSCASAKTPEVAATIEPTKGAAPAKGALDRIKEKGAIYVGFNFEIPYDYITEQGEFKGFDPDIVKYCAKNYLGDVQVIPAQTPWDGLIPGLLARHYDVIAAGMARLPKRMEVIDFSDATWYHGSNAMVLKGNPNDIHSWEDIAAKKLRVGSTMGGADLDICKERYGLGDLCVGYTDYTSSVTDLRAKRIDVIVNAELLQRRYVQDTKATDVEFTDPWNYYETFHIGLGFHPDDDDLREVFNTCIAEMKSNGELSKILLEYGLTKANMVEGKE